MNAEFQRRAKRDKKHLSEQCKEIEESTRIGRLEISSRDTKGDTKGTFHAKTVTIKDKNSKT